MNNALLILCEKTLAGMAEVFYASVRGSKDPREDVQLQISLNIQKSDG